MATIAIGLLLAQLAVAGAPPIHRCVGTDGVVAWQDQPCADAVDARAVAAPVAPEPPRMATTPVAAPARARRPRIVPPRAPATRAHAAGDSPAAVRARCRRVRAEVAAIRERDWNRLDFRARSQLDARVAAACRP